VQSRKWENAFTIDTKSWGLNRNASYADYMTVKDLVHTLIEVVAFNGNVLLNVGPGHDGTINPIFIDRLLGIGKLQIFLKQMVINPAILINSQKIL
jgi:alpha-L-fucosidase